MFSKITVSLLLSLTFITCSSVFAANDAYYYTSQARALLTGDNLSDLRSAYEILDEGFNATPDICTDCAEDRELIFFHAVTGMMMWGIRDDGGQADSFIELMRLFDVELNGNAFDSLWVEYPVSKRDTYRLPANYEQLIDSLLSYLATSGADELDSVLAELDSIYDSPEDPFYIILYSYETGLPKDIELDYGELMAMKALLFSAKNVLYAQMPYDICLDDETRGKLINKYYAGMIDINGDILDPNPYFGKVLPTPNDPNDGTLAFGAIKDQIPTIALELKKVIEYIKSETDPQDDDIIVIDPNFSDNLDILEDRVADVIMSLINDEPLTMTTETSKFYELQSQTAGSTWQLDLHFNTIEQLTGGSVELVSGSDSIDKFEVTDYYVENGEVVIELLKNAYNGAEGIIYGNIDEDETEINDATLEYWGYYNNTYSDISGVLLKTETQNAEADLNPIFGNTARYPDPVSPRDLLPEFDRWQSPLPGTVGHGLGDDPTLGGILPGITQHDWQVDNNLQPTGAVYINPLYDWQKYLSSNNYVGIWLEDQLVFEDTYGDSSDTEDSIPNTDIDALFLAYDEDGIYGHITFNDYDEDYSYGEINLYLHNTPEEANSAEALKLRISYTTSSCTATLYRWKVTDYGYGYWTTLNSIDEIDFNPYGVDFLIGWEDLEGYYLAGRFITLNTAFRNSSYQYEGESNDTHLRIANLGAYAAVSGNVTYDGYIGTPIYIQAYTDLYNPGSTVIAETMLTEPGQYTFDEIPVGTYVYLRAFTPLFNADNPLETDEFDVSDQQEFYVWTDILTGIDLDLKYPPILQNGIWQDGELIEYTQECQWFALDALEGGSYTIEMHNRPSHASVSVCKRDGHSSIIEMGKYVSTSVTPVIDWVCPASGRYYVKAKMYYGYDGTYQVRMTTDVSCPSADIAAELGTEVMDCNVDILDLAALSEKWRDSCSDPLWCEKADINNNGTVDIVDVALMAEQWLMQ